jgi:hypothetical protein
MYCLCVNVYCHRVSTQLQLKNISISIYRYTDCAIQVHGVYYVIFILYYVILYYIYY